MKSRYLLSLVALGLIFIGSGCASTPSKSSGKGQVEFRCVTDMPLALRIRKWDPEGSRYWTLSDKMQAKSSHVIDSGPGAQKFEVTVINAATTGPQTTELEVEAGAENLVNVRLVEESATTVARKEYQSRGTYKGRYGRAAEYNVEKTKLYRLVLEPKGPAGEVGAGSTAGY